MNDARMPPSAVMMENTVREFLKVAGGDNNIAAGLQILADDILMHMDGRWTLQGHARWRDFIRYLRRRRTLLGLRLACDKVEIEDDRATFFGHWYHAERDVPDGQVVATFRFNDDRIVELWSRRTNYVSLFGKGILTTPGFYVFAYRALFWCRLSRREK